MEGSLNLWVSNCDEHTMIHHLFGFVIWYTLRSDFDIEQFCCATGALGDVQKTTIKIIDKDMHLAVDLWISAVFRRSEG